jgi:hypothetical protein
MLRPYEKPSNLDWLEGLTLLFTFLLFFPGRKSGQNLSN